MSAPFEVTFWGVRGSIPCSGPATARYGGNSSCVEMRCGDRRLVFDAGSGIRQLAATMTGPQEFDLLFSHFHYDHVIGLPFCAPLYRPHTRCRLWGGRTGMETGVRQVLSDFMAAPLFPLRLDFFAGNLSFHDFRPGESIDLGDGIRLQTAALNHQDGATGYRVEFAGRAACYVTDTEQPEGRLDPGILRLIDGADLFIYDCTYTDEEYPAHKGWSHSTWQEGMRLADAAGVGTFAIFHHDPGHDDDFMDGVAAQAEQARPGTIVSRDGMSLML
ncbi:MBL fold metallo-hydrolase [Iodidimonas sp. SYSU 1G8]|uniref:MBL fold metallo-hydrolase n=1 Tax=Iodidimonas sp. SYSU 1G8 TaxID=3133967 RepID=UPI0031FF240F